MQGPAHLLWRSFRAEAKTLLSFEDAVSNVGRSAKQHPAT